MVDPIVLLNVSLLLMALFAMSGYAYLDAPEYGMDPTKWALVSALVPLFGFFTYIFERDERTEDKRDTEEMFVDGPFKIHKSRADDVSWASDPESGEGTGERDDGG